MKRKVSTYVLVAVLTALSAAMIFSFGFNYGPFLDIFLMALALVCLIGGAVCVYAIHRCLRTNAAKTYELHKNDLKSFLDYMDAHVKTTRDILIHAAKIKEMMTSYEMVAVKGKTEGKTIHYFLLRYPTGEQKLRVVQEKKGLLFKDGDILCEA